ncbi:MAG TPA: hypothetical protein VL754_09855 [Verrucomicrobiae bacterium]|jgi:hypothetical protein|nr:hypothetical protein [Verrucomicrobiae bacterium]
MNIKRFFYSLAFIVVFLNGIASAEDNNPFQRATATAQLLAGIAPAPGDPVIDRLAALESAKEQHQWMDAQWSQVRARLETMEQWRSHELGSRDGQTRTLIYPFSGPDFLNAYEMAPDYARYIFFSLERPGALPDLTAQSGAQFKQLLQDVRGAFRDIFERNYFITDYMSKQLATPQLSGTVPVMATMMALLDLRIVRIEPVDLFPDLTKAYAKPAVHRPAKLMRGVRIDFVNPKIGRIQQVYYFSLDASDKALEFYPGFLDWVGRQRPATAFLKSASYLLHDNQFAKTREMLLNSADVLIEDDTGIPYRFLNHSPWRVRLYGRYAKPIKALSYGYQPDLEAAYQKLQESPPLAFPFGYHWRTQKSGIIVAVKEARTN